MRRVWEWSFIRVLVPPTQYAIRTTPEPTARERRYVDSGTPLVLCPAAMPTPLTVTPSDPPHQVALPQSVLDAMGLHDGDALALVRDPDGSVRLVPLPHDDAATLEDADAFMASHAEAFQTLAS